MTRFLFILLLLAPVCAHARKIMLFGGPNHEVYLGCLSCNEYASDSVKNTYGPYGSEYSSASIFNEYSQYGSPYSSYSVCNEYASEPPVVVDEEGNYYGRATLNQYRDQTNSREIVEWLERIVCANR